MKSWWGERQDNNSLERTVAAIVFSQGLNAETMMKSGRSAQGRYPAAKTILFGLKPFSWLEVLAPATSECCAGCWLAREGLWRENHFKPQEKISFYWDPNGDGLVAALSLWVSIYEGLQGLPLEFDGNKVNNLGWKAGEASGRITILWSGPWPRSCFRKAWMRKRWWNPAAQLKAVILPQKQFFLD